MEEIRRRYRFYGYVQGVGFRYRAKYVSESLGLCGFVRNCYDGSVEMEIQGKAEVIDKAISMIRDSRYIEISNYDVREIELGFDRGFHIR